jgi:hypothetical protein
MAEIDRLASSASALAGADAPLAARLSALRQVIYESGAWNGGRPFKEEGTNALQKLKAMAGAFSRSKPRDRLRLQSLSRLR